jgi:hypothetical protein
MTDRRRSGEAGGPPVERRDGTAAIAARASLSIRPNWGFPMPGSSVNEIQVTFDGRSARVVAAGLNSMFHWQTVVGLLMMVPLVLVIASGGFHYTVVVLAFFGLCLFLGRITMHGKRDVIEAGPDGVRIGLADPGGSFLHWSQEYPKEDILEFRPTHKGEGVLFRTPKIRKMVIPLGRDKAAARAAAQALVNALSGYPVGPLTGRPPPPPMSVLPPRT